MSLVTVDTTNTLEAVLVGAGPLVGVVIGAWGTARIANAADKRQHRGEITRALANFMAAAELVAVELGSFPADSWLEQWVDRRFPPQRRIGSFVQRLMYRAAFGQRLDDLRRQYQQARAEVVLIAPIQVIGLVTRIDDFLLRWADERGPHMGREWETLSDELRLTAQTTVDQGGGRPYRAGEQPMNAAPTRPNRLQLLSAWSGRRVAGVRVRLRRDQGG